MNRLKSWLVLFLLFTATHVPLLATAKNTFPSDFNPLEMYETVKSGAWRHLNPEEIRPEGIGYSAGQTGVTAQHETVLGDEITRYQTKMRAIEADFMYQLALLPTLTNYCLEHAFDDAFLGVELPPKAIDDFFDEAKIEIPARSYHLIHNVIGTRARFDFFKGLMPDDFLDESSWNLLSGMITHIEKIKNSHVLNCHFDRDYFEGEQFIIDMRKSLLEIMQCYKPGDLVIGVGNTPQIPLRALSNMLPFIAPTILPLSGWPGRHKLSNSWVDNVITPQALLHIDTHLKSMLGTDEAKLPHRLVFVDMVLRGFGINLLIDRIDHLCHAKGWKTPPYHVISLMDFIDTYTQNVVFGDKITLTKTSKLAVSLGGMDNFGRYVPSAPMRIWDAGIPSIGKPDDSLGPILQKVDDAFKKMTL
jgi:hypothetical protein